MSEYCLRWNNHRPNLVTVFSELLTSEALVDVTLATDGHYIHAHKLVLSACSVYFKDLFGANPCKHPIVILKDIRIEDLKTVIDFIYRGEVNVAQDRLQDVLRTAESLRIKGLAENPRGYEDMSSHTTRFMGARETTRQRSSLTDSREQSLSLEGEEEGGEPATPPSTKRRKITPSHDSSESVQEEGESEERGGSGGGGGGGVGSREVKDEPLDEQDGDRPSRESSEQDTGSLGGSQDGGGGGGDDGTPTTTTTTPGTSATDQGLTAHSQGGCWLRLACWMVLGHTHTGTPPLLLLLHSPGAHQCLLLLPPLWGCGTAAAAAGGPGEWTLQQLSPWWASVLPALTRHHHHQHHQHQQHHRQPHFRPPPIHPSMAHLPSVRSSLSGAGGGGPLGNSGSPGKGAEGGGGRGGGGTGANSSPRAGAPRLPLDHMSLVAALGKEVSPQMVQALQAVAARRESFSSAAKLYAVSVTTLWRYSKKLGLSEPANK